MKTKITQLENQLSSFVLDERISALNELINLVDINGAEQEMVNMHFHSFYSYNAQYWSPMRIAWEAKKNVLFAAGIIDFDVLTGLNEFFLAGEELGLRTNVGIETRAFLHEYSDKEIDSPGEPGVSYVAGTGFYKIPESGSKQARTLGLYSEQAAARNIALIKRINEHVPDISINYDEVLTLTPSGNATERHIVIAYINKAAKVFFDKNKLTTYWADILNCDIKSAEKLQSVRHKFEDVVRTKFIKRDGFGYVQPSADTFPPVEEFFDFVKSCGAIPMESWLDGTSEGEKDARALLELSNSKGAGVLNLIPDRNWNIADNEIKKIKLNKLKNIIQTAVQMNMPIHIGTEMNKKGLPFVDDLNTPELKPYKEIFIEGARLVVGHTILGRFSDFPYVSQNAENEFSNLKRRNDFFASIGALPAVNAEIANFLGAAGKEKAFSIINDSVKLGKWLVSKQ